MCVCVFVRIAPSAVQHLMAIAEDSVSIRVSWKSPAQPNGPIIQYRLLVLVEETLLQNITMTAVSQMILSLPLYASSLKNTVKDMWYVAVSWILVQSITADDTPSSFYGRMWDHYTLKDQYGSATLCNSLQWIIGFFKPLVWWITMDCVLLYPIIGII